MKTRLACLLLIPLVALRPGTAAAETTGEELVKDLVLLYVQSADGGSFDGQRLTLDGVGTTLFFSDRPARVSGHIDTGKFLGAWGADAGADSFASDPPNATLSVLGDGAPANAVVELRDPKRDGKTVSYAVKVLEGKLPAEFGEASLFIDHHGGNAGDYIATGLGGAILGGALVAATDKPKEQAPPPQPYYGDGYYYRTAPPPPMACAPCAPCAACPR